MSTTTQPITAEMKIPEIVQQYPQTETVFRSFGIQPDGYKALQYETLGATARVHQLSVDEMLQKLNAAAV